MTLTSVELTHAYLQQFAGGILEVQNPFSRYIYRGTIESIVLEEQTLKALLSSLEKGAGYPPLVQRWIPADSEELHTCCATLENLAGALQQTEGKERLIIHLPGKEGSLIFYARGSVAKG